MYKYIQILFCAIIISCILLLHSIKLYKRKEIRKEGVRGGKGKKGKERRQEGREIEKEKGRKEERERKKERKIQTNDAANKSWEPYKKAGWRKRVPMSSHIQMKCYM